jgi:hypothetical protein
VSTRYTVTISCDVRGPGCVRRVRATRKHPRQFDHYATELFQRGWLRGYRNTRPGDPDATSDDFVAYDVCPVCAELEAAAAASAAEGRPGGPFGAEPA